MKTKNHRESMKVRDKTSLSGGPRNNPATCQTKAAQVGSGAGGGKRTRRFGLFLHSLGIKTQKRAKGMGSLGQVAEGRGAAGGKRFEHRRHF